MKAKNIQWDFDTEEICERILNLSVDAASKILGVPPKRYANMTSEERMDYALDACHHCPATADELFGLPDEIEIPNGLTATEDISDWLSDTYGFCHNGFELYED